MFSIASGSIEWPILTVLLTGCATTGRATYAAPRLEGTDAAGLDERPAAADDRLLNGPVLERAKYVRAVLQRNRSVEEARQSWRAAIARARQSGAFEDPMVTLEIAPLSIGSSSARIGYTAMISQRVPWPGKLALEESAAQAEGDAAKNDFEAARRELALTASLLYDQYFVAARSLEVNAHHVALMRSMQAAATAQFETGRGSAQDPLQAEFELTHMEHDAVILASQRDVTVAQMNELLHRDPDLPLPPPANDLALLPVPDGGNGRRLEGEAAERRPDITSAKDHARAEQARAERAQREYLPDVTLSTSYNSMWDMPEHRWMVGLSFNIPIQRSRRGGSVDEANAMRSQYEAEAARLSDMARTQVAVALKQLDESAHVLHLHAQRLLPVARDEVSAARSAFTASQAPFSAVVDAEKNLRSVELDEQVARADYDRRRAELDRALGRIPGLDGEEVLP
ncbi:MAG: TolC family protein [Myxococcota bacterium]|nr:TolC family protein [Myxococcota bacterium]